MTLGGMLMMGISCGFVTCLTIYCYYRVLTQPDTTDHMHAPLEIDTHDRET